MARDPHQAGDRFSLPYESPDDRAVRGAHLLGLGAARKGERLDPLGLSVRAQRKRGQVDDLLDRLVPVDVHRAVHLEPVHGLEPAVESRPRSIPPALLSCRQRTRTERTGEAPAVDQALGAHGPPLGAVGLAEGTGVRTPHWKRTWFFRDDARYG